MEVLDLTGSDGELVRDQLSYGVESLAYEKGSDTAFSSVYWGADITPQDLFDQITADFEDDDYGMAVLMDGYGRTIDERHQGPLETTVAGLTNIEDLYDRAGFIVVGDDEYEATWEDRSESAGAEAELCFLLKTEESIEDSLLEELMEETLDQADRFYNDLREMHTTEFEDLKARAE